MTAAASGHADATADSTSDYQAASSPSVILQKLRDVALSGAEAVELQVEQLVPVPSIALIYRVGRILCIGVSIIACLVPWCGYLMEPRAVVTVDSVDSVPRELAKWDTPLSLARAALPRVLEFVLGPLLMALCAEYHLHATRTIHGQLLEQGFKSLFPFFLGLPLVGLTLQQLPMRVDPVMSAWDLQKEEVETARYQAVQTENVGVGSYTRTNTTSTILRRSMLPAGSVSRRCTGNDKPISTAYTGIAYEFMTNDWQKNMLPHGLDPIEVYTVSGTSVNSSAASTKASFRGSEATFFEAAFTRAVYLYVDSVLEQDGLTSGANTAALQQLKLDTVAYYNDNRISTGSLTDTTESIKDFVRGYFSNATTWTSVLQANVAQIQVEYSAFVVSDSINFTAVTLDIPLQNAMWHRQLDEIKGVLVDKNTTWPGSGDVTYEVDVEHECGPSTCGILNRGLSPDPQVLAFGVCPTDGSDCSRSADPTALWLFGFGRRIAGDAFELQASPPLRKAVVRNPRETHSVTMGMLTVKNTALDRKFGAKCHSGDPNDCVGLTFALNAADPTTNTPQFLLLSGSKTGITEFESGFDLNSSVLRGRPLVTRFTTGVRAEFEILKPKNFDSLMWNESLSRKQCSLSMERSLSTTLVDNIFIEQSLQVTYTAGLFFLFDNARLVSQLPASMGTSLDLKLNVKSIDVALVVPLWQALLCLLLCVVLVSHCLLLYVKSHKSVSEGSIDKLQKPEVLVRALADSNAFPRNLVQLQVRSEDKAVNLAKVPLHSIEFGPFSINENGFFVRHESKAVEASNSMTS